MGGPKGHGDELMINIAIVSMHAIPYIDILGPNFVMSGGAMAPLAPPVPPPMMYVVDESLLGLVHGKCPHCKRLIDRGHIPHIPTQGGIHLLCILATKKCLKINQVLSKSTYVRRNVHSL